jgi:SAM-dependent methyltransferase
MRSITFRSCLCSSTTLERRGGSRVGSVRAVLDRLFEPLANRLADLAALRRPDQLREVGCGTGSTTVTIARRMGTKAPCVGVDISEPMPSPAGADTERVTATFICAQRADLRVRTGKLGLIPPSRAASFSTSPQLQDTVDQFLRPVQ